MPLGLRNLQGWSRIHRLGARPLARQLSSSPISRARRYVRFENVEQSGHSGADWHSRWKRLDMPAKILTGAVLLGGVYYVAHLEQIKETGRWRFMDVSPKTEQKLALYAHREMLSEYQNKLLPPHHPVTRQIRAVVQSILHNSNLGTLADPTEDMLQNAMGAHVPIRGDVSRSEDTKWNLLVVSDDRTVNASATWGTIIVFTGILPITRDANGLAAVLGHEIAHATLRHPSERMSSMKVLTAIAFLLSAFGLDFGISNALTSLALELPNGRKQELEADKLGMMYAAKSCFDPRAAAQVQSRLDEFERSHKGSSVWDIGILRTHPRSDYRAKLLESFLPEAYDIRASNMNCDALEQDLQEFRTSFLGSKVRGVDPW